ncbi:hypothetical protein B4144_4239 [Bacillus atrophaeus]|nr:hypothetical protein B4144_4239 [Bacillus atrophaeus]
MQAAFAASLFFFLDAVTGKDGRFLFWQTSGSSKLMTL